MRILLFLLSSLVLASCSSLPEPQMNPVEPHLKVVTYNVNWGGNKADLVARYLIESDADIIFLQETHKAWEKYLKHFLAAKYPHAEFKHSRGAGGIAFFSKYPLHDVKLIKPQAGWFPGLKARVETKLGAIQLLNVHLKPPLSDTGSVSLSAYYQTQFIHKAELKELLAEFDPEQPLIIAGDFNENEDKAGIQSVMKRGFESALLNFDDESPTWKWNLSYGLSWSDRYDHLIYNKFLRCTGAQVKDIPASDHFPVMAVFTKEKPNTGAE